MLDAPPLNTPPPGAVELPTDVGPLLIAADDRVMRPLIEQTHDWEIDEATLFRAFIRPGATVVDVGAHVGYYTLLAAGAVGADGRVIAFEPHPFNALLLRANVQRNLLDGRVRVVEAAAWGYTTTLRLAESAERNTGDHRIHAEHGLEVRATSLDEAVPADVRVDVVKIDAQGTDHVAFSGMRETIAHWRPVMMVEFWPDGIRGYGDNPSDVIGLYASMYRITVPGVQTAFHAMTANGFVALAEGMPGGMCTLVLR
jgi:FkbM family methyltransferase